MRSYKQAFDKAFAANIKLLQTYDGNVETAYQQVVQLMELAQRKRQVSPYLTEFSDNGKQWALLVWDTIDQLKIDMVNHNRDDDEFSPENYFSAKTRPECESSFHDATESLTTLTQRYDRISQLARQGSYWQFNAELSNLIQETADYHKRFTFNAGCINQYSSILNDIVDWLNNNTVANVQEENAAKLKKQNDVNKQFQGRIQDLRDDTQLVTETFLQYATNKIDKTKYLETIMVTDGNTLISRIELFQSSVKTDTIEPLKEMITDARDDLKSRYREALNFAVSMDTYLEDAYFYRRASRMNIWRLPVPNIDNPSSPVNAKETLDMWEVWDQNMPILKFVQVNFLCFAALPTWPLLITSLLLKKVAM